MLDRNLKPFFLIQEIRSDLVLAKKVNIPDAKQNETLTKYYRNLTNMVNLIINNKVYQVHVNVYLTLK